MMRTVTKEKCQVCGRESEFVIDESASLLREATCTNCGASIRTSDIAGVVDSVLKEKNLDKVRVLNLASQGKIHELYCNLEGYACGEFFEGVPSGSIKDGVLCIDLQDMPFEDDSFDLVISEDVLEHVWDVTKAVKEINRVLKIGGKHVFTVPVHENSITISRKNNPLKVYYGEPLRSEGARVITDFGRNIDTFMDGFGMKTTVHKCHIFHKPEEISIVDKEAAFYEANKRNMLRVFRYNSIVVVSEKKEKVCDEHEKNIYVKSDAALAFTGERFVPGSIWGDIESEHVQRYYAIQNLVEGKKVLDAACGAGYGSAILAETAQEVTGIDISRETVEYDKNKYKAIGNLKFIEGSVTELPFSSHSFDVIVSYETIEHVDAESQQLFLKEIKRCLKPDGMLIMSTPDKLVYTDIPGFHNEFHVKEFYKDEYYEFLNSEFKNVVFNMQGKVDGEFEAIYRAENEQENSYFNIGKKINDSTKGIYIVAICSDENIQDITIDSLYGRYEVARGFRFLNNQYDGSGLILPQLRFANNRYSVRFNLDNIKTDGKFRFDPLEGKYCVFKLLNFSTDVVGGIFGAINADRIVGNEFTFYSTDPMLEITGDFSNATYLDIQYEIEKLPNEIVERHYNQCIDEEKTKCGQLRMECDRLGDECNQLRIEYNRLKAECSKLNEEREKLSLDNSRLYHDIEAIRSTKGYRTLEYLRNMRNKIFDRE